MDKNRKIQLGLTARFVALLAGPGLLWLGVNPFCDTTNYENRTLTSFPTAQTSIEQWPGQFEDWLEDHAPFRNGFLTLKAGADRLVGSLDSSNVLLGKEGWLFLQDVSDSKSLSDYQGLTSYSQEEMAALAGTLEKLNQVLAQKGSRLALIFAPAKEGVYSQYMPDSIPVVSRPTRVQALVEYLNQNTQVPVLFPLEELNTAGAQTQVYYKYDTHWNDVGAWLAAQQLLEALDLPFERTLPTVKANPDKTAPTDLANMCGSWAFCTDDLYYEVDAPAAQCAEGTPDTELTRYQGDGAEDLLLVRDSFGAALGSRLAQGFDETVVIHGNLLSEENLARYQATIPQVVVVEVGERFSDNLAGRLDTLLAWAEQASPSS